MFSSSGRSGFDLQAEKVMAKATQSHGQFCEERGGTFTDSPMINLSLNIFFSREANFQFSLCLLSMAFDKKK